jgi:hypothetical protein
MKFSPNCHRLKMRPRKFVRAVAIFLVVFGFAWFLGGFIIFSDASIQVCGSWFCGRQKQPHTERDFERFEIWEAGLKFGWPLVLVAMWWLNPRKPNPYEKLNAKTRENARNVET